MTGYPCLHPLASVDVDKIAREMDFQSLQQNIMNVTFCNIESEVSVCDCPRPILWWSCVRVIQCLCKEVHVQ